MNSREEAAERRRIRERGQTMQARTVFSLPLGPLGRFYVSRLTWRRDGAPQTKLRFFVMRRK